jgi:hypothetical protein
LVFGDVKLGHFCVGPAWVWSYNTVQPHAALFPILSDLSVAYATTSKHRQPIVRVCHG